MSSRSPSRSRSRSRSRSPSHASQASATSNSQNRRRETPKETSSTTNGNAATNNSHQDGDGNVTKSRLHVSNMPPRWTDADLRRHFSKYGEIQDSVLFKERNGPNARYAFIQFASDEQGLKARDDEQGKVLEGSSVGLTIRFAQPRGSNTKYEQERAASQNSRLFISNLGVGVTEAEVRAEFGKYGNITDCSVWLNRKAASFRRDGEPSPACFLTFSNKEEAQKAKAALHDTKVLRGREPELLEKDPNYVSTGPLIVDFARPPTPKGSNFRAARDNNFPPRDRRDRGYDDRDRYASRYDSGSRYDRDRRDYRDDRDRHDRRDERDRYDERRDRDRHDDRDRERHRYRSRSRSPRRRSRSRSRSRGRDRR